MNYILLELDTTPPQLEIYAPKYTTKETENHITIESNERLSTYQEIYIIDSNGNKFNLHFDLKENILFGKVKFNHLSLGIATLFVRVKDEVDNLSDLYQHKIEIKDNISRLRMEISQDSRPLFISKSLMELKLNTAIRDIKLNIET